MNQKISKKGLVLGLVLVLVAALFVTTVPMNVSAYTTHASIVIVGNSQFTAANGVVSGSGTEKNPYVIKNWEIDAGSSDNCISIKNTDAYFVIKNCNLYYSGTSGYRAGIYLENVKNGIIKEITCQDMTWGILMFYSDDNTIKGNTIKDNLFRGIYLEDSTDNTLKDNTFSGNGFNIHLSTSADSNTVADNTISSGNVGVYVIQNTENIIKENTINDCGNGIYMVYCDNSEVEENTVSENSGYALLLGDCNSITVKGNTISNNYFAIYVQDSSDNVIQNNEISDSVYGVEIISFYSPADDNTLTGNTISGTQNWGNIYLQSSNGNTIKCNKLTDSDYGMWLWGCDDNTIEGNQVTGNGYGIALTGSSSNTVSKNTISNNRYGILLDPDLSWLFLYSKYNEVYENSISNNNIGMIVYKSDSNTFYHNNIMKNTAQLFNILSTNTWDNGAGEGNYWSNYKGKDTNHDGVGDTMLPHQGVDNCPLMKPYL